MMLSPVIHSSQNRAGPYFSLTYTASMNASDVPASTGKAAIYCRSKERAQQVELDSFSSLPT